MKDAFFSLFRHAGTVGVGSEWCAKTDLNRDVITDGLFAVRERLVV